jgi:hypothetical protein
MFQYRSITTAGKLLLSKDAVERAARLFHRRLRQTRFVVHRGEASGEQKIVALP